MDNAEVPGGISRGFLDGVGAGVADGDLRSAEDGPGAIGYGATDGAVDGGLRFCAEGDSEKTDEHDEPGGETARVRHLDDSPIKGGTGLKGRFRRFAAMGRSRYC